MEITSAARCVSIRELSRSTGELDEVERDEKVFVVSRHGRMVGLLMPLPERLILEFSDGVHSLGTEQSVSGNVDVEALSLSDLACEFLVDAASTPTGTWHAPDSAFQMNERSSGQSPIWIPKG